MPLRLRSSAFQHNARRLGGYGICSQRRASCKRRLAGPMRAHLPHVLRLCSGSTRYARLGGLSRHAQYCVLQPAPRLLPCGAQATSRNNFSADTLFLAVNYLDRFLAGFQLQASGRYAERCRRSKRLQCSPPASDYGEVYRVVMHHNNTSKQLRAHMRHLRMLSVVSFSRKCMLRRTVSAGPFSLQR